MKDRPNLEVEERLEEALNQLAGEEIPEPAADLHERIIDAAKSAPQLKPTYEFSPRQALRWTAAAAAVAMLGGLFVGGVLGTYRKSEVAVGPGFQAFQVETITFQP